MVADMPRSISLTERYLMGVKDRHADLVKNMEATLSRIKSAVEGIAP